MNCFVAKVCEDLSRVRVGFPHTLEVLHYSRADSNTPTPP